MTLTIPISRFRRLLFAVLLEVTPARAPAAAHAQLAQLYDRWGTAVFRAAYAYLRNKSDAEDVLQDPFLQYMRTSRNWNHRRTKRRGCSVLPST